jgi:RND superfamily putative drug exporter
MTLPAGRRAKWAVIAVWIALLVPAAMLAGQLGEVEDNDNSAWLPADAESTEVAERVADFMPAETVPAIVVYERAGGVTGADLEQAEADVAAFAALDGVDGDPQGPFVSEDGEAMQIVVPVHKGQEGWDGLGAIVDDMTEAAAGGPDGLDLYVTGPAGNASDSIKAFGGSGALTAITALVVVAILLGTYRSPVLPLLPLAAAGGALVGAEALIYLLAKHAGLVVNNQTSFILTVLVFGAATDYALLLVSRYREELRRHEDRHKAMAEALHRSGPALVASAATVAVSLMLLMFAALKSTQGMGPACAIGIVVGLAAMTTLMPALLVVCGRWVFWPVRPRFGAAAAARPGVWTRIGALVAKRPRAVWIGTAVVLGAMAVGLVELKADGLAARDQFTSEPQSVVGEAVLAAHFPAGTGDPVLVLVDGADAADVADLLSGVEGIAAVGEPVFAGSEALIAAELEDAPTSDGALAAVERAREAVGGAALVGGSSAVLLDTQEAAERDSMVIIPIVLAAVFLVLALLLRALVAPLLLIATVVLSFGAALGVSALVFEHVFGFAGAEASFPLLVFVFLVALGVDYNIFLVARVRELAPELGTKRAALEGLSATGGVITSAGLVLAGTFAAMGSLSLVFAAELGFAVAFGVLLDTLVVRSVLVTALTLDMGRLMWWPSRLGRRGSGDRSADARSLTAVGR